MSTMVLKRSRNQRSYFVILLIFSGEKPFEFRNHIGRNWGAGSRLYIYESKAYNGAGMVVGDATIDEIVSIPADEIEGIGLFAHQRLVFSQKIFHNIRLIFSKPG